MERHTLLVELVTEELPPKALPRLGEAFGQGVYARLVAAGLAEESAAWRWFATPRRLAVQVPAVAARAAGVERRERLMPEAVAFDAAGEPTPALTKRLAAKGLTVETAVLERDEWEGKPFVFVRLREAGAVLEEALAGFVASALEALPIPKRMRWGAGEESFVRPVHRLVMLWGDRVVPGSVLGLTSARESLGHRFLGRRTVEVVHADAYEDQLAAEGKVIADFALRRERIWSELQAAAAQEELVLRPDPELLDEVTALVEWPAVYACSFDEAFLAVPPECLILTMRANQKYFPLFTQDGQLSHRFLVVSNMRVADPRHIVQGNERVVRPRLADARFFFEQDRKVPLEERLPRLAAIVYHNRIGTLRERVARLEALAGEIARMLGRDPLLPQRAARLAKCDLVSEMVGEFPELQGIMGRYYAAAQGEPQEVAEAIAEHYRPRFAGDALPQHTTGAIVALADKLDQLTGLFGIGETPTGEKDPYGLRRAALGVLRLLLEIPLPLSLEVLIAQALALQPAAVRQESEKRGAAAQLRAFCDERLRFYLREQGYEPAFVDAVLAIAPARIDTVPARLAALRAFAGRAEAERLAQARKRVVNLLKKAPEGGMAAVDVALLAEAEEKALFHALHEAEPLLASHLTNEAFEAALQLLATLADPIDAFFDRVMVLTEAPLLRANRLALLQRLKAAMDGVADLSVLAAA